MVRRRNSRRAWLLSVAEPPRWWVWGGRNKCIGFVMLYDFIIVHRDLIIERARLRVRQRPLAKSVDSKLEHGVPLFLTQLAGALAPTASLGMLQLSAAADAHKTITDSATLHGHDLLRNGFTMAQVVHGYGDVCQVVTELCAETNAAISVADFQVFNRCLDDAIAGAVTAYGRQRECDLAYQGTERLGVFTHEVRALLNTAIISFDVIKKGMVGLTGSTGAIHARSLAGLGALVERSLAEVRLAAGVPSLERVLIGELMEELEVSALMQAEGHGVHLTVSTLDGDVAIDADRQLLASAVSNLLQNAFKYTRPGGHVSLATRATTDRVAIDVRDECGGLPAGKAEELFRPLTRGSSDQRGLGLGLSVALSATCANSGELRVSDVPGTGCVFSIELPRHLRTARPLFQTPPHAAHGALDVTDQRLGGTHDPKASVS
jgi:signal transduction histidine kinase